MSYLKLFFIFFICLNLSSCARRINKAVSNAKYSAWEMVGMEKRDLFKREVKNVKEEQEDTREAFKDALTELKEIYGFDGGNLEKQYEKFKSSLDDANEEASELRSRIVQVDKVANDLFEEWQSELNQIKSGDLKNKSALQLRETKKKYKELEQQLKRSDKKMDPVLTKLNDQVLFLKHNLNAQAIAGLKTESRKIQEDIKALIKEVDESNRQAEELIKTL
jgi:chromosome segregation ATPase